MNRETDTVFLQTLGKFISAQIQLAMQPMMQTIDDQAAMILKLTNEKEELSEELNGAIEGIAAEISRLEKLVNDLPKPEVIQGKDGIDGKDGVSVDLHAVSQVIQNLVAEGVKEEISKFSVMDGVDGKDGANGLPGPPGKDGANGMDGKDGLVGRDGADVVSAFRDSDEHLILTLSNGVTKDIGRVHGKDGAPGTPGKDGRDGFSLDNFDVCRIDERTIELRFIGKDETLVKKLIFPILIDRGVWKQGNYLQGDVVTLGGSLFIAQCDTTAKPESNNDWRLAVKRGRDGKDGAEGPQGKQGPAGKDGRDLTQLGPDGRKWG